MLINKLQTKEDIEAFRKLSTDKVEEIIKDSPEHLLQIISDILLAFLLKENVPIEEAEELAGKIKEKKMGLLFENMEKMDIQAERRNTEEQRRRAEAAEEKAIRLFIEAYREFGADRATILQKVMGTLSGMRGRQPRR